MVNMGQHTQPFFSICIDTCIPHNQTDSHVMLNEFAAQDFVNFEIILGSDTESSVPTDALTQENSRLRYAALDSHSSSSHRANQLVTRALGRYVLFPTPELSYGTHFLQETADELQLTTTDPEILYAPLDNLAGVCAADDHFAKYFSYHCRPEFIHLLTCNRSRALSPIWFQKEALERYGPFKERYEYIHLQEYALRRLCQSAQIRAYRGRSLQPRHLTAAQTSYNPTIAYYTERLQLSLIYAHQSQLSRFHGYERLLVQCIEQDHENIVSTQHTSLPLELEIRYTQLLAQVSCYKDFHDSPLYAGQPQISIIMITDGINRTQLTRAFESLLLQSEQDFEVICIQNSGNSLEKWLDPFRQSLKLKYLACPEPVSRIEARKIATEFVEGRAVAYLSDHAAFYPTHLATLQLRMDKSGMDFVLANGDVIIETELPDGQYLSLETWQGAYTTRFDQITLTICPSVSLNTVMHRATLLRETEIVDIGLEILDDWFYLLNLMSGRTSQALVSENTVSIYETIGFKNSPLGKAGIDALIREYDRICLHLQTFGKQDAEQRQIYRAKLQQLHHEWSESILTHTGFTKALEILISKKELSYLL